jgi:hypothetical protein
MTIRKPRLRKSKVQPTAKDLVVELLFSQNIAKTPVDFAREISRLVANSQTVPVRGFSFRQVR